MEFEDRNPKPEKSNGTTPTAVLVVLIGIVCLLLYMGWNLMSDDVKNNELVNDALVAKEADSIVVDTEPSTSVKPDEKVYEENKAEETAVKPAEPEVKKTEPKETKPVSKASGELTGVRTVKSGETFFGIANKFNVSASTLKIYNPDVDPEGIKVGVTKLNVPVQAIHTVGPGDILRVVASKYDISVEQLMAANGKTKNFAERGEKLLIPFKSKK